MIISVYVIVLKKEVIWDIHNCMIIEIKLKYYNTSNGTNGFCILTVIKKSSNPNVKIKMNNR